MKKPNVFISYRRADTGAVAGRIKDSIERYLPKANIFMDVESIAGGEDFKQNIIDSIQKSDIVLILIGEHWATNSSGENRMIDNNDFVRLEVAHALNSKAKVYPILINDAKMPGSNVLPEDIIPISHLNALEIRHSRFLDDLKNTLMQVFGLKEADFKSNRFYSYVKSTLFGLLSGGAVLLLIAFFNKLLFKKALNEVLGDEITISLLVIVPIVFVGLFLRKSMRH